MYKIRRAKKDECIKIARLYKELRSSSIGYLFPFYMEQRKTKKMRTDEYVAENIIKPKIELEKSRFYVLEFKDTIVWFIYWTLFTSWDTDLYENLDYIWWELNHIFIEKEHRWKWLWSKLRDKLFEYFKSNNVRVIEISVNQDNPSYQIYKKWWFESKYCYVTKEVKL